MLGAVIFGLIVLCANSQASSIILERHMMIHHEPPFDGNRIADKSIIEKYITQPIDHFNHQDNRTFSMVNMRKSLFLKDFHTISIKFS